MMSASAGLKEFGDGDAALFNGNIMHELDSQEDFESEFNRLLCGDSICSAQSTNLTPNPSLYDPLDDLNLSIADPNNYLTDFFASPPETLKGSVKFVEDPLSTHLNFSNSIEEKDIKKIAGPKRGRPKNLTFTSVHYDKTTVSSSKLRKRFNEKDLDRSVNTSNNKSELIYRQRRSDSDYYSPSWIKGRGVDREGLCPLCDPSVWFKIKQSAYWYHLNFYHGISATTGKPYNHPISYKFANTDSGASRVEGHCGQCLQWIFLSSDFMGNPNSESVEDSLSFTTWYKHAQKCHYRTRNFEIPDDFCGN